MEISIFSARSIHLEFLTAEEKQKILFDWNNTTRDYPADKTIYQLFEAQVETAPSQIALFYEDEFLTYAELNERANQLAHYLQKQGAKPDSLIALCMDPSLDLIIAILAILKSGGAYVPFDSAYPKERLQFMLEDCQAALLITKTKYVDLFKKSQTHLICLDKIPSHLDKQSSDNLEPCNGPDNLAYIIYTSGSTGKPKGVMITHRNVVNFIHWFQQALSITRNDIVDFSSSISFDFSVATTLFPLATGAKIAICPQSKRKDLYLYIDHLIKSRATIIKLTPSRFRQLKEFVTPAHTFESLRWLVFGGEATFVNDVQAWLTQFPHHKLLNEYGPTETTVATSWIMLDPNTLNQFNQYVPIGKPAANSQLYILDKQMNLCPIGTIGELYVGGVGVAKGYLNRSSITMSRFIPNPFAKNPNAKLYKTGDLCKYLPDGNIEFVGRIDHQVKIRGFRVETSEIELCLISHDCIKMAVVHPRESRSGEKQLVAYYVLEENHPLLSNRELRHHLKKHLPEYMIPTSFVRLMSLPMNANGKLDRQALPEPPIPAKEHYVAPRNELERILQTIWLEVFNLEYISVEENFFELGGHSLAAARIISKIGKKFHKEIKLQEFYNAPTIRELASLIRNTKKTNHSLNVFSPPSFPNMIPLSEMQLFLWLAQKFHSKAKGLNIIDRRRLSGKINIPALNFAFECVFKKHPILYYHVPKHFPGQYLQKNIFFNLIEKDIKQIPDPERETELSTSFSSLKKYTKWKKGSPLLVAKLFYLDEETSELQICISHLISDEVSSEILFSDLSTFYVRYLNKLNLDINVEKNSYLTYTLAERNHHHAKAKQSIVFWSNYLKDATSIMFTKNDILPRASQQNVLCTTYIDLPENYIHRLKSFCAQHQLSITDSLCAAVGRALTPYVEGSQKTLALNLVKSTRDNEIYDNTIGFFVRNDIIKIPVNASHNLVALAKEVHHSISKTSSYQACPGIIKIACLFKKHWENKKISNFIIKMISYCLANIFHSFKLNPHILAMYGRMFLAGSNRYFLAEVNIMNNFLENRIREPSYLFGMKLQKIENFQGERMVAKNIVDICFERDYQNKNHLIISGNLQAAVREKIGKNILQQLSEIHY